MVAVIVDLVLTSGPAAATFGCTVGPTSRGYGELFAAPDLGAEVLRKVPDGDMVSLIDDDDAQPEGWAAIAHARNGSAWHGEGLRGWMRTGELSECG